MQEGGGAGKKVMVWHRKGLGNEQSIPCRWHNPSLASHTLCREEGFGYTVTIELLPRQKLAVTNEIHALYKLHLLSWSSNYVTTCLADVSILSNSTV